MCISLQPKNQLPGHGANLCNKILLGIYEKLAKWHISLFTDFQ